MTMMMMRRCNLQYLLITGDGVAIIQYHFRLLSVGYRDGVGPSHEEDEEGSVSV